MSEWLPSEHIWLNRLAEQVLDGSIILVRAVPRWGISSAFRDLAEQLGESAVMVDGRKFTELDQKSFREKIDSDVRDAIAKTGYAQLLFDNYGHAIRRSQGGHLHSMLYRLLVDSSPARDTGALLAARPNDLLDPGFAGSPLISRARHCVLPTLSDEDARALDIGLSDLRKLAGDSTWLARRALDGGLRQGWLSAVEHLSHDRRRIVEALPPGAINRVTGVNENGPLDAISRESLACFGCVGPSDEFEPARYVTESGFLEEVHLQNPSWPAGIEESARRFADLLAGAESALWVDRYLFSEPKRVRKFLDLLRAQTSTRLRLLVSDLRDRAAFPLAIAGALDGVENVEVRLMHWSDRKPLHDRHLMLPSLGSGYVLPTAGVVLALDHPGTAVAARIRAVDYAAYWSRATVVFPAT